MNFSTVLYVHFMSNFSFYTLKSFLVLYLTQHMGLETAQALLLFGNIMGLSYFISLWNSNLADKYFSTILSIMLGIFLLIVGFLSIPFLSGNNKILGFTFICFATGFYKPSLLAEMSRPGKDRPQKATTYYYATGNLSTIASGIIAGTVINFFGMDYVFFLLAALLIPLLCIVGSHLNTSILDSKKIKGLVLAALSGGGIFISLNNAVFLKTLLPFLLFGTMAYLFKEKTLRKMNIFLALAVFTAFAMFIEIFSGATTLFIEHHVCRDLGSYTIPTSFFHSINPFLLIGLTGLIILLKNQKTSPSLAIFFRGSLFLLLGIFSLIVCSISTSSLHLIFLLFTIFCQTLTEFLVFPRTLQMLGENAQNENRQRTMSLWLGCISGAHILAAHLSGFCLSTNVISPKEEFFMFYLILGGIALVISLILGIFYYLNWQEG